MKLTPKEVAPLREKLLKKQKGLCALCKQPILEGQATLDHNHKTGRIRGVLHRQCNSTEGRILNWAVRTGRGTPEEVLQRILRYWRKDYSKNPIHPNHGRVRKRRKRRRRK